MSLILLVNTLFQIAYLLLLVRVILSWVPGVNYDHPAVQLIVRTTSPLLNPIRRVVPLVGGLDLSPMIAIVVLILVRRVVMEFLIGAAP